MRRKILVVDDEPDFLKSIVHRLQLRQYDARGADCGEKALELVSEWAPDVVVLDVKMPGIDGIETLRRIRARSPQIAVIMLTGHGSRELNETGIELGAFDYLMKPVHVEVLIGRIEAAITDNAQHP
jgi:DNA-binding response OmpR family regulator